MGYTKTVSKWREVADKNPRGFVQYRLRIPDLMGREIPFSYKRAQLDYSRRKQLILKAGVPLRLSELKYRRAGFSSVETAESFAQCYGRDHARIGVIAHLESRAGELLQNYKSYNATLNTHFPQLKQEMSRDNLFGIKFEESQSTVLIASAENPVKIRGDGLHIVHCSEFAHFFQNFTKVMNEIAPVVPPLPGSQIILESTGTVVGSAPHEHWQQCTPWEEFLKNGFKRSRGCNDFVSHFCSWLKDPECEVPFTVGQEAKEFAELREEIFYEEPKLAERNKYYNLTPTQINASWKMYSLQANHDYRYFCREFPYVESDAWSSGGESVFDSDALDKARPQHPAFVFMMDRTNLCRVFDSFDDFRQLTQEQATTLDDYPKYPIIKIWAPPIPGQLYVLGADSALGNENGDYCAGYIINKKTREMCAAYHGRMRPDEAAHINVSLCRMYNRALAAPEVNPAGGGTEVLNIMQRLNYSPYYVFKVYDHVDGIVNTNRLGWYSNSRTRPRMLGELRKLFLDCIRERLPATGLFRDASLLREMREFHENPRTGKWEAMDGCFDDRIIALAIAHQVACDELAGSRYDIIHQYHPIMQAPRPVLNNEQRMVRMVSPEKTMMEMFGKNSRFNKNKFSFDQNNNLI